MEIKTYTKIVLKLLRLPIGISAAIISSLYFFPTAGIAQDYPVCFMINSSGQVMNLDNLCQSQDRSQAEQKAKACQGPFDKDGFPIALYNELKRLDVAVATAKQKNMYVSDDPEVQSAMISLLAQMPFSTRTHKLLKEQKLLFKQLQATANSDEAEKLQEKLTATTEELGHNLCLGQLVHSLTSKFRENLFF